ncbi:MAG: hypothetical protein ABIT01_03660, partial [Thermoanaerobaculia bacterium]
TVSNGTLFLSDGWIRNRGTEGAPVDIYYTPEGKDGLTDPSVQVAKVNIGPYSTYRLSDFVRGLFRVTSGSGHVEVRSKALPQLSIRTTVDSLTRKGDSLARYGAEIPSIRSAQGAGASANGGASLHITGISGGGSNPRFRTNVILAETSGKSASVNVKLYDRDGNVKGQTARTILPYSKIQINNSGTLDLFPAGVSFDGGSLEIQPTSGEGRIAAFATVLDNVSQAYTTRTGRFVAESLSPPSPPASLVTLGVNQPSALEGAMPSRFVIPAAAHVIGINDSLFTTKLSVLNPTGGAAEISLTYKPDTGPQPDSKQVSIPGRSTLTLDDVVGNLFGLTNSAGMILLDGPGIRRILATSDTSASLVPGDPSRGVSPSTLAAYAPESPEAVGDASAVGPSHPSATVSHPAIEESARFRSNLILAEVYGKPVSIRVRLVPAGTGGVTLAEYRYDLLPFERKQFSKFIRQFTGNTSDAVQFVDIETIVEWVSGEGRVIAVVTKIDNDPSSKRTDIYVLGRTGEEQGFIGF